MQITAINVSQIVPEPKDIERAQNLEWRNGSFFGNGAIHQGKAEAMAKLIKDPIKLVRRAKAVIITHGIHQHDGLSNAGRRTHFAHPWLPFRIRLAEIGFTYAQITLIMETARRN